MALREKKELTVTLALMNGIEEKELTLTLILGNGFAEDPYFN